MYNQEGENGSRALTKTEQNYQNLEREALESGLIYFQSLTKTEQNYQNLEREALGTIWGMEKFHYFLYGKEFTLETNQEPLVSIYKKHMIDISPGVKDS